MGAMTSKTRIRPSDVQGASRLAVEAIAAVTDLVEAMHRTIARGPDGADSLPRAGLGGIPALVYRGVRGVTRFLGAGIDIAMAPLVPLSAAEPPSRRREALLAAVNGVLGDHLASTGNPLAIPMRLRRDGHPLALERAALAAAIPEATGKLLVLAHGICMSDLQWDREGHDHGAALACDLGYTPVYLHYNSGLHISANGRAFADTLEELVREWPVPLEELVILGHSMGGLVARSACHYGRLAGHGWLRYLGRLVFLGTPHHGSPLERAGNWVDVLLGASPYSAPLARVGKVRSAGVTDLRYGNLLDEDWEGKDRFARAGDRRQPVPLPDGVACYAIAATEEAKRGRLAAVLPSDGLVPLDSALGRHRKPELALDFPEGRRWIAPGTGHFDLLCRAEVYARIRDWLSRGPG
ncbi:MAG TPA: alpha/beta hydrolase [Burkholderiales bacterium]|nr:alpha/beta hydrolase [Burkholderiales bacterium]